MRWLANAWVQTAMLFASAVAVYVGSLVAADVYNVECTPLLGQPPSWARQMPPVVPGFPSADLLHGVLLVFPPMLLIRTIVFRRSSGVATALFLLGSAYYLAGAWHPTGCVNSGGQTDQYDAPGIFVVILFFAFVVAEYSFLIADAITRFWTYAVRSPSPHGRGPG